MAGDSAVSFRKRVTVEEAAELIAANMPAWPAVRVPLHEAGGGVLRENLLSERDQPPFDRVTMDGIAIAQSSLAAGIREFRVIGAQAAGAAARTLGGPGECVEVMTGGVLPGGADCIVPVERLRRTADRAAIETDYRARPEQFIHRRGSDQRQGDVILTAGTTLGPPEMAILTIGGKPDVAITRRPRIAVISTGDELVDAGAPIEPWQIRSSNDRALAATLLQRGFPAVSRTTLRDDPALLAREIDRLFDASDVLILSGGVSMGQFDFVPKVLTGLGVTAVFHKITQRPGMPMWFGVGHGKPVFALPGNPVSSLVCLVRHVIPGLYTALGAMPHQVRRAQLEQAVDLATDLTVFLPVQLGYTEDGRTLATPKPTNTSGDFVALGGTDGFIELPRGQDRFQAGYGVDFYPW